MSFGKMNTLIEILIPSQSKDSEGFILRGEELVLSCRAYKEERHGNEGWKNRATFSTATALFRFRKTPNIDVTTEMVIDCSNERFNIISVEDVRNRGMYIEVLCEKVMANG